MSNKLLTLLLALCSICVLTACSNNTALTYNIQQGACPDGVNAAPYCMAVQIKNSNGQTWVTSSSYAISNLVISTPGATNIQTPNTSKATMDPNNCTGSTIAPGADCTFYLKINYESYPTNTTETVNLTLNYSLNNNLFGGGDSTGSSSFTIYEVTNLYAVQANGWVGIFNATSKSNFLAESYGDTINTSAVDTGAYGFLFLGGNLGIYPLGNESGIESANSSIMPATFNAAVTNLYTISSNLYAGTGNSVWSYALATQTWATSASFTLGVAIQPNANAISPSGVLYLAAGQTQVFRCGGAASSTTCLADAVSTNSGVNAPGTINTIAFPATGTAPFTGLYIGANNGLFAESQGAGDQTTNTWVAVSEQNGGTLISNSITAMVSATNGNYLYAADKQGNIWYVPSAQGTTPTATKVIDSVGAPISAITLDTIGGILYFATSSGGNSTLYSCNIAATPSSCKPEVASSGVSLYPVVSLSIGSQLITTGT